MAIIYEWRGEVNDAALGALHAEGFGEPRTADDRVDRLRRHSLGWVCAWEDGRLVGFVNVAWDGGGHAFLLDTVVARRGRGRGVGTALVARATEGARAAGCQWLHVDHEDHLRSFYTDACGFRPTAAGLIAL
ncbi:GNAT family N-acetyltransferase [Streptomyces sp. IB2014 016-6]|uniref:GNAT family N-acetyltransferase n=1 Tax=Streptomyces sp. IB2014 016-6 TaxID=2517818 RepID=UPI0011CC60FC|nr:GNAT family N-acetyltransferase [Streptomyces sp. IB2014 016-6]TXL86697.1 GNAT family N-acetyltransferase [Streptomyces sp. IB2014 016-6]